MGKAVAGAVAWDGSAFRVMPDAKTTPHTTLTESDIKALPKAVWNVDSERFELAEEN